MLLMLMVRVWIFLFMFKILKILFLVRCVQNIYFNICNYYLGQFFIIKSYYVVCGLYLYEIFLILILQVCNYCLLVVYLLVQGFGWYVIYYSYYVGIGLKEWQGYVGGLMVKFLNGFK